VTTFRDRDMSAVSKAEHTALLRAALQTGFIREAPSVADHSGPILVEAELRAVVALTHNQWKNRLDVSVEVPDVMPQFWCRWWIVRLAAMRMVMLAAESEREAPSTATANGLPSLHIIGKLDGARFELQMRLEGRPDRAPTATVDSVLGLCAKSLDGAIETIDAGAGTVITSLSCPVSLSATEQGSVRVASNK
jgi:hypothetical protein